MFSPRCITSYIFALVFAQCAILSFQVKAQSAELYVAGVAQDAGHPQLGCERSCCKSVGDSDKKQHRVSSIVISDGSSYYFIDATPDLPAQWNTVKKVFEGQSLGGIFLTHAHIGHYTGLMYLGKEGAATHQVPIYAMPRMRAMLANNAPWSQLVSEEHIALTPLTHGNTVQLGKLAFTPMLVPHRDEFSETVGFLIQSQTGQAFYIPDIDKWKHWDERIDALVSEVDIAFLDGTFYADGELPGRNMNDIPHPFVSESMEALSLLSENDRSKVYFIHFNHTNPLLDEESDATEEVKKHGFNVATEGMRITF